MDAKRVVALVLSCVLAAPGLAAEVSEPAAAVTTASGVVVIQKADGTVRSLASGSFVRAGDVITTQANSTARLKFSDGAELTVSPNSQVRVDSYLFNGKSPQDDSFVMSLLKGGLRNITGLVGRRGNRDAYKLQTRTATIGIRGTDFIARLCADDCAGEIARAPSARRVASPEIPARVAQLAGQVFATDDLGTTRPLAVGSGIRTGEVVQTREKSYAVLVFVDEGRITLQPEARFLIERFRYEPGRTEPGQAVMRLLAGGMRAVTGILARRHPQTVRIETTVATIGIRGTGFDAWCSGVCVDQSRPGDRVTQPSAPAPADIDGLIVTTWEGEVEVRNPAGSQNVGPGQTVQVATRESAPRYIPEAPPSMRDAPGPRPDGIEPNIQEVFGAGNIGQTDPGLYVLVKDGQIALSSGEQTIELARGEAAYAGHDTSQFYRMPSTPTVIEVDPVLTAPSSGGLICGFR